MASRHHSLDLSEVMDVTDLLLAFELQNQVSIKLSMMTYSGSKGPDMVVTGEAWENKVKCGEVKQLASVSVRCSATNLKHFKAVVTHVLYALDFRIALNEFESVETKRA